MEEKYIDGCVSLEGQRREENGNHYASQSNASEELSEMLKDATLNGNYEDFEDEPFTAPFEILAEFLSALMSRDYKSALHYCKLILQYEPENLTVQEFYPLIEQKIKLENELCTCDETSEASDASGSKKLTDGSSEYYSSATSEEEDDNDNDDGYRKYCDKESATTESFSSSEEEGDEEEK